MKARKRGAVMRLFHEWLLTGLIVIVRVDRSQAFAWESDEDESED